MRAKPEESLNKTNTNLTAPLNNSTSVEPAEAKVVKVVEDRQIVLVPGQYNNITKLLQLIK